MGRSFPFDPPLHPELDKLRKEFADAHVGAMRKAIRTCGKCKGAGHVGTCQYGCCGRQCDHCDGSGKVTGNYVSPYNKPFLER